MRYLFCDAIIALEPGRSIVARKAISLESVAFGGRFPRQPQLPAGLVVESIAQAAGWLNFVTHDRNVRMVAALVANVHFVRPVVPGDLLEMEATLVFPHTGGATMSGQARVDGACVASIERLVFANEVVAEGSFSRQELAFRDHLDRMTRRFTEPRSALAESAPEKSASAKSASAEPAP